MRFPRAHERAVPLFRQSDRPDFLALGLSLMGQDRIDSGELAAAQALLDEALDIYAHIDEHSGQAMASPFEEIWPGPRQTIHVPSAWMRKSSRWPKRWVTSAPSCLPSLIWPRSC